MLIVPQTKLQHLMWVLLSVGLVILAGPSVPWVGSHLLIWVALVPLGIALSQASRRQGMWLGFAFGGILWLSQTWGLTTPLSLQPGLPWSLAVLLWGALCLFAALPYLIFGWLLPQLRWQEKPGGALRTALLWVVLTEWLPGLFPVFPVHALAARAEWMQALAWGGTPLLQTLVVWVNWLVVQALLRTFSDRRRLRNRLLLIGLLPSLLFGWGRYQLESSPTNDLPSLQVGWVQPNFPSLPDNSSASPDDPLETLLRLTTELVQQHPYVEVLLWPEIPFPLSWTDQIEQQRRIRQAVRNWGRPLLLVSGSVDEPTVVRGERFAYRNVAHWIDATGVLRGSYAKQRLLPVGEYLPGEERWPLLREWLPDAKRYLPGTETPVFPLAEGIGLQPAICYEAGFREVLTPAIENGARVLWNPTNDGWFPASMAAWHRALIQFRSAELGLPLLRVTNSGYSVFSDSQGRILQEGDWNQQIADVVRLVIPNTTSPWFHLVEGVRWVLLGWVCLDVFLGLWFAHRARRQLEEEAPERTRPPTRYGEPGSRRPNGAKEFQSKRPPHR